MSGPWEQYVEKALLALWRERFGPSVPVHEFGPAMQECVRDEVRAALAAVGPLIQEDTRERMVAAAGAALEREGAVDPYCQLAEIREIHAAIPVPQPSQFTVWCNECSTTWPCTTAKILEATA